MLGNGEGPEGASGATEPAPPGRAVFGVPLETKLYPPALRKEWVERQELIGQLSGSTSKLILVDAPAGFGKTTLVAQWRARAARERRFAWVSLDRDDNDPVRLWRHVVEALQRASPEVRSALGQVRGTPDDLDRTLLPLIVNALAAAKAPVVLVLDDYHLLKERACHQQFEFLLLHLPRRAQLVVITRADPPLPLARLRASGDLTEIRARELGFTPAQATSFVHAVAGVRLSRTDAADLVERTEGWPAGIYMVALSLRDHPAPHEFIRGFTGSNRFVVDFLTEEVLSRQPHHIRQFLTRTSILGRFTAPLCDAVAGTANAAKVLDLLERENLFLVPLDDDRQWYRYHQLFRQMLRSQLARSEPDLVPELHRRASAWYRDQGSAEEAIRHALAADDARSAVDLIARYWYEFVFAGRTTTVRRWIQSLRDDRIRGDPLAAHVAAWIAALWGDQESVRRWLPVIEAAQHDGRLPDGMRSLQFSAALVRASFGFDGIAAMREWSTRAVELDSDPASPWHSLALGSLGWALYLSGERGAAAVLGQAVMNQASIPLVRMLTLATSALLATDEGRHAQAGEFASAARAIADRSNLGDAPQASPVWTAVATVHASERRYEQARTEFEKALDLRRRWFGISPWENLDTLLRLAQMLIDTGNRTEAAALMAEAGELLTSLPDGAQAQQARLDRLERRLAERPVAARPTTAQPLTEREEAVLRMLRGALSLREIGQELFLSANTIKTHTRAIYRKLGATTRAEAVERGYEAGLLP
jgi:LuxR family maltose regulon positive regulatory protein